MSFPTADMMDAFNDYLDTSRIAEAIREQRPDLAEVLLVEDGRPMLRLTLDDGRAVVGAKISHNRRVAWTVATPDRPIDPTFATSEYPGGSIAAWMVNEYDRLSPSRPGRG